MSERVLPEGVAVRPLSVNLDQRGSLTEIHRAIWREDVGIKQWVAVHSRAGSLRGLHAHARWEFYVLLTGTAFMGIHDTRPGSPSLGTTVTLEVDANRPCVVQMAPLVLHGTYFRQDCVVAIGFSEYYTSAEDELGCQWNAPQAGIAWPCTRPILSARDAALPSYAELLRATALAAGTPAK